jgi:hypothetical protein
MRITMVHTKKNSTHKLLGFYSVYIHEHYNGTHKSFSANKLLGPYIVFIYMVITGI